MTRPKKNPNPARGNRVLPTIRVYELAKEFGLPSKKLVDLLREMKIDIRNHMSTLNPNAVELARARYGPKSERTDADLQKDFETEQEEAATAKAGKRSRISAKEKRMIGALGKSKTLDEGETEEKASAVAKVKIHEGITAGALSKLLKVSPQELIKEIMEMGSMATLNQRLDLTVAETLVETHGFQVERVKLGETAASILSEAAEDDRDVVPRAAVVTVMGHVDHGKTLLLDTIRKSKVVEQEKGGITQHIGAYRVDFKDGPLVFLDTPGHEAFSAMRARGAKITDIIVLVVAGDDGVMPQTEEAIDHAKDAAVPIIVALNKMDLPDVQVDKIKQQLADKGLNPDDWGGKTPVVEISAKTGKGVDKLLELIQLQADLAELKAPSQGKAQGVVLESSLSRGQGPMASVLIQKGSLQIGASFVAGSSFGRIRAMVNDLGEKIKVAGPSIPVQISGLQEVVEPGEILQEVDDIRTAKRISEEKSDVIRLATQTSVGQGLSLESYQEMLEQGEVRELKILIKTDVQGSAEALADAVDKLGGKKAKVSVVRRGVGPVSKADVTLAMASKAIIITFGAPVEPDARKLAEHEKVQIKKYDIIYRALDDIHASLEGLLDPEVVEEELGRLEVKQVFRVPKGFVAGSSVRTGKVVRGERARVLRGGEVIHTGEIISLRRFKEDVGEVGTGFECGVGISGVEDLQEGDELFIFGLREKAAKLV